MSLCSCEEGFAVDPTGNWAGYLQKTSGTMQLDQERDYNEVSEITDTTESTAPGWSMPVHNAAGNMTTVPKPARPPLRPRSWTSAHTAVPQNVITSQPSS